MKSLQLAPHDIYLPIRKAASEIRLLILSPYSTSGHLINCRSRRVSLEQTLQLPQYEAISYCWGDASNRACITVDGRPLVVPRSAKAALQRMKLDEEERTLWIDAVCINQADLFEKSWQVAMMGLVYRRATAVLIELGSLPDEGPSIKDIAECLQRLDNRAEKARHEPPTAGRHELDASGVSGQLWGTKSIFGIDDIRALESLFGMPWFQRLWVVQEVLFNSQNLCFLANARGDRSIQFPLAVILTIAMPLATIDLQAKFAAEAPYRYSAEASKGLNAAMMMSTFVTKTSVPFHGLCFLCTTHQATDPRDRVFALVELHRWNARLPEIPDLLQPDYTRSTAAVYRDASRYILADPNGAGDHELLAEIFHSSDHDLLCTGRPSWAFDFKEGEPVRGMCSLDSFEAGIRSGHEQSMWPRSPVKPPYVVEIPDVLQIRAFTIGAVVRVHDPVLPGDIAKRERLQQALSEVEAAVQHFVERFHTQSNNTANQHRYTAEMLSCFSGRETTLARCLQHFQEFRRTLLATEALPTTTATTTTIQSNGDRFSFTDTWPAGPFGVLMRVLTFRRLAICASGHIGILPLITRVGDLCVIAEGAQHPFVLREYEDGYRFVGVAYMQELMHGQVFGLGLTSKPMMIL